MAELALFSQRFLLYFLKVFAEVCDCAGTTFGTSRHASIATVEDQPMVRLMDMLFGQVLDQLFFYF
jgi:hypothetical protein